MKKENLQELREIGFTIVRNLINQEDLKNLSKSMDICFNEHKKIQIKNGILFFWSIFNKDQSSIYWIS